MISAKQAKTYLDNLGYSITIGEVNNILANINQEEIRNHQADRVTWAIWDKTSAINGVSPEGILSRPDYLEGGEIYLIYIDGVLTYLQPHHPQQAGLIQMTQDNVQTLAATHVSEIVDELTNSYIFNGVLEQVKISYVPMSDRIADLEMAMAAVLGGAV